MYQCVLCGAKVEETETCCDTCCDQQPDEVRKYQESGMKPNISTEGMTVDDRIVASFQAGAKCGRVEAYAYVLEYLQELRAGKVDVETAVASIETALENARGAT